MLCLSSSDPARSHVGEFDRPQVGRERPARRRFTQSLASREESRELLYPLLLVPVPWWVASCQRLVVVVAGVAMTASASRGRVTVLCYREPPDLSLALTGDRASASLRQRRRLSDASSADQVVAEKRSRSTRRRVRWAEQRRCRTSTKGSSTTLKSRCFHRLSSEAVTVRAHPIRHPQSVLVRFLLPVRLAGTRTRSRLRTRSCRCPR